MNKPIILFLYGVTIWITVSRWYGQGNSGIPDPKILAPSSYLFAILALTSDFLEGIPVILAAGLTFILYTKAPAKGNKSPTPKAAMKLGQQPAAVPTGGAGANLQGPVGASGKPLLKGVKSK